jgi:tRNA/tmRNA/rRNA uracil-C5-methylase (TrmA/RlmC/RlmD family)
VGGGYALSALTAVDQFKWTSHVEIVAVFRRA